MPKNKKAKRKDKAARANSATVPAAERRDSGSETISKKIKNKVYQRELAKLQIELVKLQEWIKRTRV